jgi:hypothetical protein
MAHDLDFFYDTTYLLMCVVILKKSKAKDMFERCREILKIDDDDENVEYYETLLMDFLVVHNAL